MQRVLVWDLVVRVFHIVVVVGFSFAYVVAKFIGEDSNLFPFHMMVGLMLACAVLLRVLWGLTGTKWARLSTLLHGPKAHLDYAKSILTKAGKNYIGHNPASSMAIIAVFGLLLTIATTGYLMSQGYEGLKDIHEICANILAFVAIGHICGVLLHTAVHRDGIIPSMLHGKKEGNPDDAISNAAPVWAIVFAAVLFVFVGGLVANYRPQGRTTSWPVFGGTIHLGEGESWEGRGEGEPSRRGLDDKHERYEEGD